MSAVRTTPCGLRIHRHTRPVRDPDAALRALSASLDTTEGLLLRSAVQQPGRYARYDLGYSDPPLKLRAVDRTVDVRATRPEGLPLVQAAYRVLQDAPFVDHLSSLENLSQFSLRVIEVGAPFDEAERTRQPSVLSVLRALLAAFGTPQEPHLGFYGAVGYDLVFQFEELQRRMPRHVDDALLSLAMPDRILVVDREAGTAEEHHYRFELPGFQPTKATYSDAQQPQSAAATSPPHVPFETLVKKAKAHFARGELFEVTPSQTFVRPCEERPSVLFERLCEQNPAPYGFLANLGQREFLIGASPEMFVRVRGRRVETSPIAGTIARGQDALQDAAQIRRLLQSDKDEDELTMCTDVDRNDKARVCEPGSVKIIGRRQIELYSRLIHTVDHVEGTLRDDMDALDAFLTHCWAVTVTGAPKLAAMQFIEDHEATPRGYYGGAVGVFGVDGHLNTGLVLRTIRLRDGQAEVRAGATLLHASDPAEERRETELKASALLRALEPPGPPTGTAPTPIQRSSRRAQRVLLVDHQDSFVHTLSDYFQQAGAHVTTVRSARALTALEGERPDLVVLSPGPGRPEDFETDTLLTRIGQLKLPTFGVCLGLQAMVLHQGGQLTYLDTPRHGNPSTLHVLNDTHAMFKNLPQTARVGRYHSMCADLSTLPETLEVLARSTDDGHVMAVAHRRLPWSAVQFHPESLMSAEGNFGLTLVHNVLQAHR